MLEVNVGGYLSRSQNITSATEEREVSLMVDILVRF
jgi:hypothetical protein